MTNNNEQSLFVFLYKKCFKYLLLMYIPRKLHKYFEFTYIKYGFLIIDNKYVFLSYSFANMIKNVLITGATIIMSLLYFIRIISR